MKFWILLLGLQSACAIPIIGSDITTEQINSAKPENSSPFASLLVLDTVESFLDKYFSNVTDLEKTTFATLNNVTENSLSNFTISEIMGNITDGTTRNANGLETISVLLDDGNLMESSEPTEKSIDDIRNSKSPSQIVTETIAQLSPISTESKTESIISAIDETKTVTENTVQFTKAQDTPTLTETGSTEIQSAIVSLDHTTEGRVETEKTHSQGNDETSTSIRETTVKSTQQQESSTLEATSLGTTNTNDDIATSLNNENQSEVHLTDHTTEHTTQDEKLQPFINFTSTDNAQPLESTTEIHSFSFIFTNGLHPETVESHTQPNVNNTNENAETSVNTENQSENPSTAHITEGTSEKDNSQPPESSTEIHSLSLTIDRTSTEETVVPSVDTERSPTTQSQSTSVNNEHESSSEISQVTTIKVQPSQQPETESAETKLLSATSNTSTIDIKPEPSLENSINLKPTEETLLESSSTHEAKSTETELSATEMNSSNSESTNEIKATESTTGDTKQESSSETPGPSSEISQVTTIKVQPSQQPETESTETTLLSATSNTSTIDIKPEPSLENSINLKPTEQTLLESSSTHEAKSTETELSATEMNSPNSESTNENKATESTTGDIKPESSSETPGENKATESTTGDTKPESSSETPGEIISSTNENLSENLLMTTTDDNPQSGITSEVPIVAVNHTQSAAPEKPPTTFINLENYNTITDLSETELTTLSEDLDDTTTIPIAETTMIPDDELDVENYSGSGDLAIAEWQESSTNKLVVANSTNESIINASLANHSTTAKLLVIPVQIENGTNGYIKPSETPMTSTMTTNKVPISTTTIKTIPITETKTTTRIAPTQTTTPSTITFPWVLIETSTAKSKTKSQESGTVSKTASFILITLSFLCSRILM